ncbi:MAG TPA: sulfurtransferase TusE, partial [Pseudomonas sp.]|nr:sulfurtransferase TusE [Pseudomonas sp.]
MNTLIVDGRPIEIDQEGYLADLNDWSEPVAEALALQEDLTLEDEHWEIL